MPTITENKAFFVTRNWADDSTYTASSSNASFPVANLKTEPRRQTWRTTSISSQYLTIDLGSDQVINTICFVNHNFSQAGEWSLYGHTTNIFPSGTASATFKLENQPFYPSFFGAGEYMAGWGGSGGVPDDDQLTLMGKTLIHQLDQTELRYWHIVFSDPTNTNSYFEIGRLFFGYGFQPTINFNWGHDFEVVDPSRIQETKGGGLITKSGIIYRQKKCKFSFLSDQEKYFDFYHMIKTIGKSGNFVVCFFPLQQEAGFYFETFYGKMTRFSALKQTALDTNEFSFTFRELV